MACGGEKWDLEDHNASLGVPAGRGVVEGGAIPYQPAALAKKQENFANRATLDPESKCYLPGVPRITYMPHPFQIVQQADKVSILYEYLHAIRYVYMNGNPHPRGPIEWWMGDSRGRWEGNTLVVDVIHFNDLTWFDRAGNFHSDALHVVERYTPTGPDHMLYEVTIEDPKVFTRPWKMSMPLYRRQERDAELLEYQCHAYLLEQEWNNPASTLLSWPMKERSCEPPSLAFTLLLVVWCCCSRRNRRGQAFWAKDTPKLPMAKTWVAQKAKLPPTRRARTPDGVPDLQGAWSGAGGDGTSFLEDHEYVDVTTPAQESFVSDPPDGKVPIPPGRSRSGKRFWRAWRGDGPASRANVFTSLPRRFASKACPSSRSTLRKSFRSRAP